MVGALVSGVGVGDGVLEGDDLVVEPHLSQPFDWHFGDSGVPSRHFVIPSTHITPP